MERLLAVQAQDGRGARLTVRSRSTGLRAADVDDALTERRSLVVTWLNRGTLHLVGVDDFWWLHPITTPQIAVTNRRRLHQEGVSDAQADTRGRHRARCSDLGRTANPRRAPRAARTGASSDRGAGVHSRLVRGVAYR